MLVPIGKVGSKIVRSASKFLRSRSSITYFDHCSAKARATSGKVLLRYLPRELRTNCFGLECSFVGMMGGRFLSQYSVFLVYLTPNHDG